MKCPKCQTELPEIANFCLKCGQELNVGEQPPRLSTIPEAERKRVTALFSDLSGYTSMTEKLDPEEVKEITGRIHDGGEIMMGGEIMNEKAGSIFEYLKLRQDFENAFPGYESEIHGVERTERDGKKFFRTLCVKQK